MGLSWAPAGISPSLTYRQSAIARRLASATMPTRRIRPPALAKRRLNQSVKSLSGWKRSQLQASSVSNARTRRLPALLMPCSRSMLPLACGVGVRPRLPASSRRLANCRQPKTSLTRIHAPFGPTAREGAAMVYDSVRNQIVLFGGHHGRSSKRCGANLTGSSAMSASPSRRPSLRARRGREPHLISRR